MSIPEPVDIPDTSATVLYVGNLDRRVTDVMMTNILRTGLPHISERVLSAKMFAPSDPAQGPDGYCFVQFQDNNSACQAMTFLNGREFCGKKVKVNWATNSGNGQMPKIIGSSVTIFVGDLDDDITDGELRQAFDPFGDILNAKVCRDAVTNKSKNYGFISFTSKPDAEKAIREMHGSMLKRRPIKTNWATRNQKTQPAAVELDYDQVYKETTEDNCTVYVTNLPDRIAEQSLSKHFELYGKIIGSPRIFEGKNFAFIKFDSHAAAATAIVKANGSELNGCILKCWWGKDNTDTSHSNYSSHNSQPSNHHHHNSSNSQPPQPPASANGQNPYNMSNQQYMQYMQYYQYWMQQYQMMQQQGQVPQGGYQYPYGYPQGAYPQQQQPGQPGAPPQMQPPQMQQPPMQQQQQQQMPPQQGSYQQEPYSC